MTTEADREPPEPMRCRFTELPWPPPFSDAGVRCPNEVAYKLWIDDCQGCKEKWLLIGVPNSDCEGHWACVSHAAEVRAGSLARPDGADLTVMRIRSPHDPPRP